MTNGNEAFSKLAERWSVPGSSSFIRILENMLTREEGELLLELSDWTTSEQLATKLTVDSAVLDTKLKDLVKRGWLRARSKDYAALPNLSSIRHSVVGSMSEEARVRLNPLWKDFFYADERRVLAANWEKRLAGKGFPSHRVMPARKALALSPKVAAADILPYEDIGQMLATAKGITVNACGCRTTRHECERPADTCIHFEVEGQESRMLNRSTLKKLTLIEALASMDLAEESGLVHIPLNTSQALGTCNCCPCCCSVLNSTTNAGKVWQLLAPSRYRAVVDQDRCSGCQTCVERCHFDAIEMTKCPNSKKLKASIQSEHCMGCGLCVFKCPETAMTLEIVRPPEHIPTLPRSQVTVVREGNE